MRDYYFNFLLFKKELKHILLIKNFFSFDIKFIYLFIHLFLLFIIFFLKYVFK